MTNHARLGIESRSVTSTHHGVYLVNLSRQP
jgi:hypothetical protein